MQENKTVLKVDGLSTSFLSEGKWNQAIHDISLVVQKGETVAIVGESGSGKSVTSLSVMGLLPEKIGRIDRGKIVFQENEIQNKPEVELNNIRGNQIAMVFQEPMTSLNPVMKCGQQVLESLKVHQNLSKDKAHKKVIELFNSVKLPDPERIYKSYPHELSGGQKQRVVIALALICDPELIIADEPTTALDVTVQKEIIQLLIRIQKERNLGMIFISHDLDVVKSIAHHIVVMYKGKIVESGASQVIFNKPKHAYTKGLIHCKPPIDKRPKRLPVISDFIENEEVVELHYVSKEERAIKHEKLYAQKPILRVKNLSKIYRSSTGLFKKIERTVHAVDEVSFSIYPGEILGLVGESGCGKTTLSRSLLKLIEPSSGEIWFKDLAIHNLNNSEMRLLRKEIQIIFQDPYSSLNPRKTIGEAIVEPMMVFNVEKNKEKRREKAIELLEKTGLDESHFDRYPHEFSGGQRQRVVIARALALSPSLLICDESVSALDVSVQGQVLNLLNNLKEEFNLTYLFISHDLSVVKYMCDRVIVMNQGRIEEIQEADLLFENPLTDYTKSLIESIP